MNIDFADANYPSKRFWLFLLFIAIVALCSCVTALLVRTRAFESQEHILQKERELTQKLIRPAPAPAPLPAYYADASLAIAEAQLPASHALAELEAASVVGIQMKSIDLDNIKSTVVVELDVTSDAAPTNYLDELNAGRDPAAWKIESVAAEPVSPGLSDASNARSVRIAQSFKR